MEPEPETTQAKQWPAGALPPLTLARVFLRHGRPLPHRWEHPDVFGDASFFPYDNWGHPLLLLTPFRNATLDDVREEWRGELAVMLQTLQNQERFVPRNDRVVWQAAKEHTANMYMRCFSIERERKTSMPTASKK